LADTFFLQDFPLLFFFFDTNRRP